MRLFYYLSLCTFTVFFSCGTSAPLHYTEMKGPYDQKIEQLTKRLKRDFKPHKLVLELEQLFSLAQHHDIQQIDSLDGANFKTENLPYINAAYRKIKERQALLEPILPLKSTKNYYAKFPLVHDIVQKERESRREAANYLYGQAITLLDTTQQNYTKKSARTAYNTLEELRLHFYPHWRSMDSLLRVAKAAGTVNVLLICDSGRPIVDANYSYQGKWLFFNSTVKQDLVYDYEVHYSDLNIDVGHEQTYSSSSTETKKVLCGEDIKKDSLGREISREPIYREEVTTTYHCHTDRSANGSVSVILINLLNGDIILKSAVSGASSFSEDNTNTTSMSCPMAPAYFTMESLVISNIHGHLVEMVMSKVID